MVTPCQFLNMTDSITWDLNNRTEKPDSMITKNSLVNESLDDDLGLFALNLQKNSKRMVKVFAQSIGTSYISYNESQDGIYPLIFYDIVLETFLFSFIPISTLPLVLFCLILLYFMLYWFIPKVFTLVQDV